MSPTTTERQGAVDPDISQENIAETVTLDSEN
jgi:hypothetical protein